MGRCWDVAWLRLSLAEGQQTDKLIWAEDLLHDLIDVMQIRANGP